MPPGDLQEADSEAKSPLRWVSKGEIWMLPGSLREAFSEAKSPSRTIEKHPIEGC